MYSNIINNNNVSFKDIEQEIFRRCTVQKYIINNFGTTTSLKSLKKAIGKTGTPISEATIARYIKVLLDAKILYECPRFDMKSKKSLSGEKKYYLSDTGFYYVQNTDNRINFGPVLENIIYTQDPTTTIYRDKSLILSRIPDVF